MLPQSCQVIVVPKHKKFAGAGNKMQLRSSPILIDQADAQLLSEGEELTLMEWGNAYVRVSHSIHGLDLPCPNSFALPKNFVRMSYVFSKFLNNRSDRYMCLLARSPAVTLPPPAIPKHACVTKWICPIILHVEIRSTDFVIAKICEFWFSADHHMWCSETWVWQLRALMILKYLKAEILSPK